MKRFALAAGLAAVAFTVLCAFVLHRRPPGVGGLSAAPAVASSPDSDDFLDRYFRTVWEAELGQAH